MADGMTRIRAWLRAKWQTAWTGSTIVEIDTDTGELVCIPGFLPAREQSFFWRLWQTVRNSFA